MSSTTIPLKPDTRDRLYYNKQPTETYDEFLNRVLDETAPENDA